MSTAKEVRLKMLRVALFLPANGLVENLELESIKIDPKGCGYSSIVELFPSTCGAMGLIPSTENEDWEMGG